MNTSIWEMNKEDFMRGSMAFFTAIFGQALKLKSGEIEIRFFPKGRPPGSSFFKTEVEAADYAYHLCSSGIDVYCGVNPRTGGAGKKENVHFVTAFHSEIDYGKEGHKKECPYKTYEEALSGIKDFNLSPSVIVHSGGGFHCYWILSDPKGKRPWDRCIGNY